MSAEAQPEDVARIDVPTTGVEAVDEITRGLAAAHGARGVGDTGDAGDAGLSQMADRLDDAVRSLEKVLADSSGQ